MIPRLPVRRLVTLVLEALLVLVVTVILAGVLLARLLPMLGHQTLIIGGGSMQPAIPTGGAVVLSQVPADEIQIGDIVSFKHPDTGTIITHRVVGVLDQPAGYYFQTKGDANRTPEGADSKSQWMLGRVTLIIPFGGYLLRLMEIPAGIAFILGLAFSLVVAMVIVEGPKRAPSLDRTPGLTQNPAPASAPGSALGSASSPAPVRSPVPALAPAEPQLSFRSEVAET